MPLGVRCTLSPIGMSRVIALPRGNSVACGPKRTLAGFCQYVGPAKPRCRPGLRLRNPRAASAITTARGKSV